MKYPNIVTCYVCKAVEPKDFMTLQDFGDHNIQYAHVPSEGRCNAFEIEDGAKVYVDQSGILRDLSPIVIDDGFTHCSECFSPSQDVNFGYGDVAVPESCKDEDCDCHFTTTSYAQSGLPPSFREIAVVAIFAMMFAVLGGLTR